MNKPTAIAERLNAAMKAAGYPSQSALSRSSGVPQPTINRILNGVGRGAPAVETLTALADACNVQVGWLMDGVGPMERGAVAATSTIPEQFRPVELLDDGDDRLVQVKKVHLRASAGISGFEVSPDYEEDGTANLTKRWLNKKHVRAENLIAVMVRGESMEPTLYDGDMIIVDTADIRPVDGSVYVFNYDGEIIVKRVFRDAGRWYLSSDNLDQRRYPRKLCEGDGCRIIGKVIRRESDQV
jgi:phage repressor protein C with HTH and peptisase S24 domain